MKKANSPFRKDPKQISKNPEFKKAWQETEPEYLLARQLIKARLNCGFSQRELARRVGTTQAVISRLETMRANPSLSLLKRLASALNQPIVLMLK